VPAPVAVAEAVANVVVALGREVVIVGLARAADVPVRWMILLDAAMKQGRVVMVMVMVRPMDVSMRP